MVPNRNSTASAHLVPSTPSPSSEDSPAAKGQPLSTHTAEEWTAPYHSYSGSADPSHYGGAYTVYFFPNYTHVAHQEFLGSKIEGTHCSGSYEAVLNAEKLQLVRRDPDVKRVWEGCPADWRWLANENEKALAMLKSDQTEAVTMTSETVLRRRI